MAKTLKDLTRVGTDARKIAALLREKAPAGHDLAWINPREAALLKASGGSGHIDPQTGIRSYEETPPTPSMDDIYAYEEGPGGVVEAAPDVISPFAQNYYSGQISPLEQATFTPRDGVQPVDIMAPGAAQAAPPSEIPFGGVPVTTPDARQYIEGAAAPGTPAALGQPPTMPQAAAPAAAKTGKDNLLAQLGIAGVGALLGARAGRRATAGAQAGAQEMRQLAAPYQQAGQQLQAAAQRGELTPGSQQALQAMQAQMAQGIEKRGGVGVAQAQAAISNLRTQLLQQQYDYGLKLSGIGDNIALGAIKTGMEADKYAAQLSQNFYSNLARVAGGALRSE